MLAQPQSVQTPDSPPPHPPQVSQPQQLFVSSGSETEDRFGAQELDEELLDLELLELELELLLLTLLLL